MHFLGFLTLFRTQWNLPPTVHLENLNSHFSSQKQNGFICIDPRGSVSTLQPSLQNRAWTFMYILIQHLWTPSKILVFSLHLWTLKRRASLLPVNTSYIVQLPLESFQMVLSTFLPLLVVLVLFVSVFSLVSKRLNKFTLFLFCVASRLRIWFLWRRLFCPNLQHLSMHSYIDRALLRVLCHRMYSCNYRTNSWMFLFLTYLLISSPWGSHDQSHCHTHLILNQNGFLVV